MVIIDAGHGGFDPGGGSNIYFKEKDITRKISNYMKKRFDEFTRKYWHTYRDMVMRNLADELRNDPSEWVMSKEFVDRMANLASKYKEKRKARAKELDKAGIVDKERFYHDLDLEEIEKDIKD